MTNVYSARELKTEKHICMDPKRCEKLSRCFCKERADILAQAWFCVENHSGAHDTETFEALQDMYKTLRTLFGAWGGDIKRFPKLQ